MYPVFCRQQQKHQRYPKLNKICTALTGVCFAFIFNGHAIADSGSSKSVEVKILRDLAVYPQYKAPASVLTLNDSQLSAEVSAVVDSISVKVGQMVKRGDLLVSLHKKDYQLALQREQAELKTLDVRIKFADYQYQRAQALVKQQAVSEELLKQRETDLAVLQAEKQSRQISLRQTQRNLAKCNVVAPYDAVITDKLISVGELANPGTPLLRLTDVVGREITAKLQSYQVASLRSAANIVFQSRADSFPVKLRSILPLVNTKERTQEIRLEFVDQKALVGVAGELVWKNQQAHVPADLLVQRNGQLGVFVVGKNNQAKFMTLQDAVEGRPALVDFSMATRIVTKGRFKLQDGDELSIL